MSLLEQERRPTEAPPGMTLLADVRSLGTVTLLAGQVLIGELDPAVIEDPDYPLDDSRRLMDTMFDIKDALPPAYNLVFGSVPGKEHIVGMWATAVAASHAAVQA